MPKFIELHLSYYGQPIYINVDTILYFYDDLTYRHESTVLHDVGVCGENN
mgnify:FL=1